MNLKEEISPEFAKMLFESEDKVYEFIASVKWSDGYRCRHCNHVNFCRGKQPFSRRCTRCKKDESALANTIFHNLKFPVNKAFYIAYHVCVMGEDFSTYQYADLLGINQMTCWKFRKRIQDCMLHRSQVSSKYILKDILMANQ